MDSCQRIRKMSKQTGLLNFFKPASAQSSNLKKPILKGKEHSILHKHIGTCTSA